MSEIFNEAAGLAKEKLSPQDNSGSVLNYLYSTLENIDPPLTIARKLGLNIPSGEDLTTLVQTVAEGVSPGTDIREMIEGSEEIYKGNVVSGGLQTLGGLAGAAIPFSKQVRGIGKVVGKKIDKGLKSLDEPVDISKKLRTGDKEKVIDEMGEVEEISKATIKEISPTKTAKAYKLFKRNPKTGELFPLFVKMGDNNPIEMNKWIKAEEGLRSSTGKVKSSLGDLAYRPGFHAGDLPIAKHIGDKWNLKILKKDKTIKKPNVRPENQVWAEVEFADDIDWQTEAIKRAIPLKSGKGIQAKTAHITDQVPTGGNYRYKTNPNMEGEWIIGGEMKVNRVLSDKEVKAINKKAGTSDLPRLSEVVSKRKGGQILTGLDDKVLYRKEGGLSSINKPISINGKRHNLAWINSDEASALKAMGGSGKKGPMGIPSYQTDEDDYGIGEEGEFGPSPDSSVEMYDMGFSDLIPDYDQTGAEPATYLEPYTPVATYEDTGRDGSDNDGSTFQDLYDRSELNSLKTQLIGRLGVPGMEAYMKGLGKEGLATVINKFHTGWDFGGAVGTAQGISRGIGEGYEKDLDLKTLAKRLKELKEENLSDEDFEEAKLELFSEYQGIADDLGGKFTIGKPLGTGGIMGDLEQTLKDHDLSPHWATAAKFFPGQSLTKLPAHIANAITNMVGHLGTFTTKEGKEFSLRDTGKLVERDLPPDPSSLDPGTVEVDETVGSVVAPRPIEVAEKKKVGLSDIFDQESKRPASNVHLSNLLDKIYGEGQGQEMLG